MKVRLAIRGFADGVRQFEDLVELDPESEDFTSRAPQEEPRKESS